MQVVLGIFSLLLLGLIIYFAVSSRSSRLLKLSAFIALGLIALAVGICSFFLIRGPSEEAPDIALPIFQDSSPAPKENNTGAIWGFLIVLVIVIGLIAYLALREQRMNAGGKNVKTVNTPKSPVFSEGEFQIGDPDSAGGRSPPGKEKSNDKENEDSFEIDFK